MNERVKHANDEIRRKDEEIEDLKEQLQIKQEGYFKEGEDVLGEVDKGLFVHDSGEKMSPEEWLKKYDFMSQMQVLKKQVKSKGEIDGDDDDRGEESQINVVSLSTHLGIL